MGYDYGLPPFGHMQYSLLAPELSTMNCDMINTGSSAIDDIANNIYADPMSFSENRDMMSEEVCFGMVCSLSSFLSQSIEAHTDIQRSNTPKKESQPNHGPIPDSSEFARSFRFRETRIIICRGPLRYCYTFRSGCSSPEYEILSITCRPTDGKLDTG